MSVLSRLVGRRAAADLADLAAPDLPAELWLDPFTFDWADEPGIRAKTGALFFASPYAPRSI
ncbi:hypothetical protein HII36_43010 [Nonomuraea sp. NN258]|uniref:hypothetical protein n=1 Tax=Nonomuraea antri TaxID=2730852 RepID=UPI001567C9D8|nr:hypothetical protein [Nonomuraea antri]NRQ38549.1 hypothetical protein [Nonomuraea antri]